MTRRCSHCSNNGHNSRTCPSRGPRLFGVRLTDGSIIKKSASMGSLSAAALHHNSPSSAAASPNPDSPLSDHVRDPGHVPDGYLSDDPAHGSCSSDRRGDRKKGIPWSEEEHRMFLIGLQKLGKGDWRGIARNYVISRTPTQVASHAQKYFIRQTNAPRRKRRSSLFDMIPDDMATDTPSVPEEQEFLPSSQPRPCDNTNSIPSLNLSLSSEFEPMETASRETLKEHEETVMGSSRLTPVIPAFLPAYLSVTYPFWPTNVAPSEEEKGAKTSHHQVLKPIPILQKEPVNLDEIVGMSQLSILEGDRGHREPSPISLKLVGEPSRQSAFNANASVSGSNLSKGKSSPIQAV
ncbi:Myb_DNA-binding domain-containing protein [Cephalotus follicularis]|uniref:Myb_DNA-binding domain-containing protein n=1 Tax=Cephalotus follicularis TaxID=3775 RepID=A0A1Q3B0D8_CEPFO|nr:Myb_DNA-binding domain-containing protein [Cephalotus follicularis]